MAGQNNFATLRQYATKEYKFKQGTSLALLDPAKSASSNAINTVTLTGEEFDLVKGGICATLAADWLREKLSSGNALFGGNSNAPGIHAGRNLDTVVRNVPLYLQYRKSLFEKDAALQQHGLAGTGKTIGDPMVTDVTRVKGTSRLDPAWVTKRTHKFTESMINACAPQFLKKGRGVYISLSVVSKVPEKRGGGHAIAAYRSRGNTLYFFDPNCGVYNIIDLNGFFTAFVACYDAVGYTLKFERDNDGFTYVDR